MPELKDPRLVQSYNQPRMPTFKVPPNTGKVRVAMGLGGKFTVWNGKQGQHEFAIPCRTRKQAEEIARIINSKQHNGEVKLD